MTIDQRSRIRETRSNGEVLFLPHPGGRPEGRLRLPSRSLMLKIHRWTSLAALVWILIISITGTVLVFGPQIEAWSRPELYRASPGDKGPQAAVDAALAHFDQQNADGAVDNISLPVDNRGVYVLEMSVTARPTAEELASGARGQERLPHSWLVFVDPGTGQVNGAKRQASGFMYWCKRGHYVLWQDAGFLGIDGDDLAGLVALAMLTISLIGIYIWWFPRVKHWFRNLRIRGRQGFFLFNLDLHRTLGMAVVLPLTVISFTGAAFSFPDMKLVWERLTPAKHDYVQNEPEEDLTSEEIADAEVLTTDGVLQLLKERFPTLTIESLDPPTESDGVWGAWLTKGFSPHQRDHGGGNMYVNIDRYSHEIVYQGTPEAGNVWDQIWEDWSLPVHGGDFLGNASRWAWVAVGLSPVVLSGTGVVVWWQRRRRRQSLAAALPARGGRAGNGADRVVDLTGHYSYPEHAECVDRLTRLFVTRVGGQARVRVRGPIRLDDVCEPAPDLTVVRPGEYRGTHPGPADVLLVVEVSDSTSEDRGIGLLVYALAGVPEVWIVDPAAETVEVYAGPNASGWATATRHGPGATLTPVALDAGTFGVTELLGG